MYKRQSRDLWSRWRKGSTTFGSVSVHALMHSSFTVRTCNTKLSDLTHDACLGLSFAWACLPNAAADLANMKGNIMDVNSAISAIAMSEQHLHFSRELVVLRVLRVLKSLLSVVLGDGGGRRWCGRGALLCQRSIQRISQLQVGGELVSLTTSCSYVFPFWMRSDRWRYHVRTCSAHQQEKPMIPLMVQEGYRANGCGTTLHCPR